MLLLRGLKALLRTRNPKTRYTFLKITFRLTQSITWKINYQNLSCEFSSLSWARKLRRYVCYFMTGSSLKLTVYFLVSGDHTRTIQIATPTVGGLMKFAVKTVTCLGCKTPLRGKEASAYMAVRSSWEHFY
jgi:hypothetical protein